LSNKLSPRQVEILHQVARGLKDREIALKLYLSVGGVKSHLQNIFKSLHAQNRTDAIVKAHKEGYLNLMRVK